ncbi:GlxA family transcriptional regulator [Sinorhizobium sp. BG8]|uniref:GlxA family transcriptional regulator n=1 Tax=Sinorhizobium sp. BG8 TaxID=2613773 RepID=UPI00193E7D47|nr:GlxA family transcriptional regulator [Sinorhizobium sp. BG8]QRM53932.1 GlxA family transcriptional regulator [Sinorhizobium sp. BG8]
MQQDDRHIQDIGFLLIDGFALMSYASASEPLRAANLLAGRDIYRQHLFSADGHAGVASSGAVFSAESLPQSADGLHTVFVCAGGGPEHWNVPLVHAGLRRLARQGVRIGGISGGPYVMAAAGLLAGHRFTIHWEHATALIEAFPDLMPERARFVIDGSRITCGGGVAPLDMMHALIAERMGDGFARRVSDWYLHTAVGESAAPQRASLAERHGVHHPALLTALEKMEATVESPLSRSEIADLAGVTPRHLDRLFANRMRSTFVAEYRRIRLDHARRLLTQSPLSVSEIAFACGYSSAGHFSAAYRTHFGMSPRAARQAR